MTLTKTQVDRLGESLKRGDYGATGLRELDQFRRTFDAAYQHVVTTIRDRLALAPTGRPAKSTKSIVEKLQRESMRLTQMQDIAGCRVVVPGIAEQTQAIKRLEDAFPSVTVMDRRDRPSHGYRAVHLIVRVEEKPVEIQVRTKLQHAWAELSEKMADVIDPRIKYGGGSEPARAFLAKASDMVMGRESVEQLLAEVAGMAAHVEVPEELRARIVAAEESATAGKAELIKTLMEISESFRREGSSAVSD